MGKGFVKKKKQARMMQEQLAQFQKQMEDTEVMGAAPNQLVTITLSGSAEMKKITIKPECVDKEDVEGLQDLIKAAYTEALNKLNEQNPMLNKNLTDMPFGSGGLPNLSSLF